MTGISLANHQGNLWSYINSYASKPYVVNVYRRYREESALVVRFTPYRNIKNWTSTQQTNITKTSVVGSSENSYPARIGIGGIKDSSSWFDVSQDPEQIFLSINEIEQIKIRRTVNDVKTHFLTMQGNWGQTGTSGIASPSTVRSEEPAAAAAQWRKRIWIVKYYAYIHRAVRDWLKKRRRRIKKTSGSGFYHK
jgi:hypothetical protein